MNYTHRNGEMEPPTEKGWYWYEGTVYLPDYATHHGMEGGPVKGPVDNAEVGRAFIVHGEFAVAPENCKGWWWGPIPVPELWPDEKLHSDYASYKAKAHA